MFSDINIGYPSVILKKKENENFIFHCNARSADGFIYIINGNGIFESANRKIQLRKNHLLILQKNEEYVIRACNNSFEYITTAIPIKPKNALRKAGLPVFIDLSKHNNLHSDFIKIYELWESRGPFYNLKAKIIIEQIFLELLEINEKNSNPITAKNNLHAATEYIERFYDKEISSDFLAELCSMSVSHFRKCFKSEYGVSPIKYRENLRIFWAKQYLSSSLLSVGEIAERLGYYDIYHFSKSFKKATGFSPREFIKQS